MTDGADKPPEPKHRLWMVFVWAVAHWLALEALRFGMTLLTRLPLIGPHLDPLVNALIHVEKVLVAPRLLLRMMWFPESFPSWLHPLLIVLNSLVWGLAIHLFLRWRRRG
jgi:hypothetical protein